MIVFEAKAQDNVVVWIDDLRDPSEERWSNWIRSAFGLDLDPVWIKSYDDFVVYLDTNGVPNYICFDNDLGDIYNIHGEKTGYDCAKYLVDYCMDNNEELPQYAIQSDNGAGRENISKYLENYKKFVQRESLNEVIGFGGRKKGISDSEIEQNKNEIIRLLRSTNRPGVENVINFLNKSRYFTAKASFRHHQYKGGLAAHSLGVYKLASQYGKKYNLPEDSIILSSILHDIGKVIEKKGNASIWDSDHAQRGANALARAFDLELSPEEEIAVAGHMESKMLGDKRYTYNDKEKPLRKVVHSSDCTDAGGYSGLLQKIVMRAFLAFNF